MRIGYPCINNSIPRSAPSTFRLASYSESKLVQTVKNNLIHLNEILKYNVKNDLLFFRISSDLIPFASHPICKFAWYKSFQSELIKIGDYIKKYNMRISMHPDQFVILNSPSEKIVQNSINELRYHCMLLDVMHLDETAKVQIHIGGVYGNKIEAIDRFIKTYNLVDHSIKKRLIIENDDHLYSLRDCLYIHEQTGIPILFDSFHHECYNNGESLKSTLEAAMATWDRIRDGLPMVDYSSQDMGNGTDYDNDKNRRKGRHAQAIDLTSFEKFLNETAGLDFDIMLEIKDKEKSALKALYTLKRNEKFYYQK
ncbi:MAG TPA: UV DNA damage repair endonuclease UvsE [Nitrososphaeraceae archaeon]|nr:UV DNA damage repair endonuclease UvsE [Nitrososphaeraceae archaeon]